MSAFGATIIASVVADDVCFQEAAKLIFMTDLGREAVIHSVLPTVAGKPNIH
ncbi:hypothetical protein [Mesorhizobium sp. KR1-2]|uniref:hypothetical protein n=1 Tax=Mesorhizobium sp. KR1-2 TaxID=3156609 RepID=UPI0032B59389